MPSLDDLQDKPVNKNPMMIVHGPIGIGKTSFAASAETPVILATEQGADFINCKRAKIKDFNDMLEWIKLLATTENTYKTIIVDSLDHFEPMLLAQLVTDKGVPLDKINGGFFRWRSAAQEYWANFLLYLNKWQAKKCGSVILLAHNKVKDVLDPRTDTYSRYVLKLDDSATAYLTESVDLIGFMDQSIAVMDTNEDGRKRGVSNGKRRLYFAESPAYLSKRRPPGIPDYIELPSASEGYANFTTALNKGNK